MDVPVKNLGGVGIVYDLSDHEVPPEGLTYAKNAQFVKRQARRFSGYSEVYDGTTPSHSVAPMWLLPWADDSNFYWLYATQTKVYRMDSSILTDVTNVSGNYGAGAGDRWTGGIIGGVPVINNSSGNDDPQGWDSTTTKFVDLVNWPANIVCDVLRVHREFLIALGVTNTSTSQYYPHMVKWSHPAAPGALPTSWDETDDAKDTGEADLAETTGHVVDCLTLGNINVVYKEGSTWGMQLIGGQSVFRFWPMFTDLGLYAVGCVGEFDAKHFVVSRDDVVVHNGQKWESVIDSRNKEWLFNNIHEEYYQRTYVAMHSKRQEAYICFVSRGATSPTYPDMALVWNMQYNTWSVRELGGFGHMAYGVVDNESLDSEIWDNDEEFWDTDEEVWDWRRYSPAKLNLLAAGTDDTKFYEMNVGHTEDGTTAEFKLQRTGLPIAGVDRQGNIKVDLKSTKFVRRARFTINTTADVTIRVGMQQKPEGAVTWLDAQTFTCTEDIFIDCMLNGRFFCWELAQTADADCVVSGFLLDMDLIGEANF